MIRTKLILENGDVIYRDMNPYIPLDAIKSYFLGKVFNTGINQTIKCLDVEFV